MFHGRPTRIRVVSPVSTFAITLVLTAMLSAIYPSPLAASEPSSADKVRLAISRLCPQPDLTGFDAQIAIPESWLLDEIRLPDTSSPRSIRVKMALSGGDELILERRQFNGRLRQFRVSYNVAAAGGPRPAMQAVADGNCVIRSGHALRFEGEVWQYLDQLEGNLKTVKWTETLQAPWPEGSDPGGVRVAMVDSGLAYDLPMFEGRLARDDQGRALGHDFWDLDPWPYDGDISRSPFQPIRHGTPVASILVREAPRAALIPFRYPRPDMKRMADVVRRAAGAGARILTVPLGSNRREDWTAFAAALEQHDMLAIVSAGNDGRDIDANPVYPAVLPLENMITVTSADAFGRLASGSNWGSQSVDIMLPAENVPVTNFRGASGTASGSSYAVPRLAALAVRILSSDPQMTIQDLKARILERAAKSPFERRDVVAVGWIPDPLSD